MVYDIVKKRPDDPAAYAAKWIQDYLGNIMFYSAKRSTKKVVSDSESSEE